MSGRNVRWHEERQDRASYSADRFARLARKEIERAFDLEKQAHVHQQNARKALTRGFHKKAAKESELAEKLLAKSQAAMRRSTRLADQASRVRGTSNKYGRAKSRIGTYSGSGWTDRDRNARRR